MAHALNAHATPQNRGRHEAACGVVDRGRENRISQHPGRGDQDLEQRVRHRGDALAGGRVAQGQVHAFAQGPVAHALQGLSLGSPEAGLRASEAQLDTIEELLWKVNTADGVRNIELL